MFGLTSGQESMTTASESKRKADTATADDLDTLLPEAVLTKLKGALLGLLPRCLEYAHSAVGAVGPLYREVTSNVPTAHPIHRVQSVMSCNFPKRQRKEEVSKRVPFTCEADEEVVFQNLIDYYLETSCAASYADMILRLASRASGDAVQWEMERDTQTRAKMIALMRSGCTQGEALTCAIKETSLLWLTCEVFRATLVLGDASAISSFGEWASNCRDGASSSAGSSIQVKMELKESKDKVSTAKSKKGQEWQGQDLRCWLESLKRWR